MALTAAEEPNVRALSCINRATLTIFVPAACILRWSRVRELREARGPSTLRQIHPDCFLLGTVVGRLCSLSNTENSLIARYLGSNRFRDVITGEIKQCFKFCHHNAFTKVGTNSWRAVILHLNGFGCLSCSQRAVLCREPKLTHLIDPETNSGSKGSMSYEPSRRISKHARIDTIFSHTAGMANSMPGQRLAC